jgi:hypothetical protein
MRLIGILTLVAIATFALAQGQRGGPDASDPDKNPFRGITTDGAVVPGLFSIRSTGVSTRPVMDAAIRFIESLTPEKRRATTFAVDDNEWRRWNNIHRATRAGIAFKDMTGGQRTRAYDLLKAGLSSRGLEKTRNVMRLNQTVAELTNNFTEYGEGLYHVTVMGEPSATEPWGWQLEGHHLAVNYFVLGDQVVMTPTFMGSEPAIAESGKYAGTKVLQEEQNKGLMLIRSLDVEQRRQAIVDPGRKTDNRAQAQAYRDNLQLPYTGIQASRFNDRQRALLVNVIEEYVRNMDDGHAKVRMDEVLAHLDTTWFAWVGETADDSVFYYRVQSPVILIEFDHQMPVALRDGPREPGRRHVHTVVRTPNGNDYGKDLLRLHYEQHEHDAAHGHVREPR